MQFLFASLLGVLSVSVTLPLDALEARDKPWDSSSRAVYFLNDDPAGNHIAAFPISPAKGTLSSPVLTPTQGVGKLGDTATSQHGVEVSGDYLFTVNTGSNTVVMFLIDPCDPLHPKLVGEPVSSLGTQPVSVAYSPLLNQLCTVNGGTSPKTVASVTCFSVDRERGLKTLGPLRSIPQSADPAPIPSVALYPNITAPLAMDILFNPSNTALFTTIRSNGKYPGSIYAYPVAKGQVSQTSVHSTLPTLPFIFGLNFLGSDSRLLTTNPHLSPVAAQLKVSHSFEVTVENDISIPAQKTTCWVAVVPHLNSIFVTDPFFANVAVLDYTTTEMKGTFNYTEAYGGAGDIAVDRDWLYFLQSGPVDPQLLVYNIADKTPSLAQSVDIFKSIDQTSSVFNLTTYPSHYSPSP